MKVASIRFGQRELVDIAIAWGALTVAFAVFFAGGGRILMYRPAALVGLLPASLVTAGLGFLLHEMAHKVTAIRFGQVAEFRADYGMLFLAVAGALAGFLFAAPGAVYHRGRATLRENGLIALAGPLTNVALGALFLPLELFLGGPLGSVGALGVRINFLLAGFNMIPFGPLDGNTVKDWSFGAFLAAGVPCFALAAWALFGFSFF
ncbi:MULTISPECIES: metalloprotease [Halorussus]|uniref:metalloprotease n=1 Tax=Halorussus TaxID=1070314 RepID=UPI000E212E69|nr:MULTISPECIES: metalloprotease [Halorussus]NHN58860.1 metalloprotease [Halorussus sp. JP-T4]